MSSPALKIGPDTPHWKASLNRIAGLVLPRMAAFSIDPALLSRAAGVVEAYRRDSLAHHGAVSAHTAAQILAGMERVAAKRGEINQVAAARLSRHRRHNLRFGQQPRIRGERRLDRQHARTPRRRAHETLNDLDRDRVIRELIDWTLVRADYARRHAPSQAS